jgi:starch synthase
MTPQGGMRKILMVSPEVAPLVKVGGLADVVGALSKALDQRGHEVRIVLPKYDDLLGVDAAVALDQPLVVYLGGHQEYARVWQVNLPDSGAICYLLEHDLFFGADTVYVGPSGDEAHNAQRFAFLSRATIDLCYYLDWMPDLIHAHDWPTGLVPVYLNCSEADRPLGRAASLMTLHNMQHQGCFGRELLDYADLPGSLFRSDALESSGQVNMLKGGIYNATKITTVSPTYAQEIQKPEGGYGLDHLLRFRSADLIGVLNGVDTDEWSPETDPHLPENYDLNDLGGKKVCKEAMQQAYGLKVDAKIPVYTVVSRLVDQKGLDLLAQVADRLMADMQIQVAVLGTGEEGLENAFRELSARYPGRFASYIGFNNQLAHLTAAGGDFLLMPSRFEPCGLSQLYAMIYGTLPIVRSTGGLIDTVENYGEREGTGTGFRFDDATPDALYHTIGWACATYYDRPNAFRQLQINGMSGAYSWDASAKQYEDIYRWAIDQRAGVAASGA